MSRRLLLMLIVAAVVFITLLQIGQRAPFEYDEAVYAGRSRAWSDGVAASAWSPHRAPALSAIGTLLYRAGARAEWPFRITGALALVALMMGAWALARSLSGEDPALLAAGVIATAHPILQRSAQFLTDVPAAAALVWATVFLFGRDARRAVFAAPLMLLAFHLRYGSAVPIATLVLAAVLVRRDRALVLFLAVLALGLVPHAVYATRTFGAPWGALTYTSRIAGRAYVGEGLFAYVRWFPSMLAGPLAGGVMLAGIARISRATRTIVAVALAHVIVIGLADHGEPRFVFFPVVLLIVAGAATLHGTRARPLFGPVVVVALIGAAVLASLHTSDAVRTRAVVRQAGRAVRAHVAAPCVGVAPQAAGIGWYSGCFVVPAGAPIPPAARFAVRFANIDAPVPAGAPVAVIPDDAGRFGDATIELLPAR